MQMELIRVGALNTKGHKRKNNSSTRRARQACSAQSVRQHGKDSPQNKQDRETILCQGHRKPRGHLHEDPDSNSTPKHMQAFFA